MGFSTLFSLSLPPLSLSLFPSIPLFQTCQSPTFHKFDFILTPSGSDLIITQGSPLTRTEAACAGRDPEETQHTH